jgi:hypothetical protein
MIASRRVTWTSQTLMAAYPKSRSWQLKSSCDPHTADIKTKPGIIVSVILRNRHFPHFVGLVIAASRSIHERAKLTGQP